MHTCNPPPAHANSTRQTTILHTINTRRPPHATGGTKPATLETGAVINVPLFIETGELIKIDTRTDTYLSRSKE